VRECPTNKKRLGSTVTKKRREIRLRFWRCTFSILALLIIDWLENKNIYASQDVYNAQQTANARVCYGRLYIHTLTQIMDRDVHACAYFRILSRLWRSKICEVLEREKKKWDEKCFNRIKFVLTKFSVCLWDKMCMLLHEMCVYGIWSVFVARNMFVIWCVCVGVLWHEVCVCSTKCVCNMMCVCGCVVAWSVCL